MSIHCIIYSGFHCCVFLLAFFFFHRCTVIFSVNVLITFFCWWISGWNLWMSCQPVSPRSPTRRNTGCLCPGVVHVSWTMLRCEKRSFCILLCNPQWFGDAIFCAAKSFASLCCFQGRWNAIFFAESWKFSSSISICWLLHNQVVVPISESQDWDQLLETSKSHDPSGMDFFFECWNKWARVNVV